DPIPSHMHARLDGRPLRCVTLTRLLLSIQGVVTAAAEERSVVGEVVARMDIEVNDYPGSSANGRHEPPRSPGRG
uniref:Uncharacterized protein n=1 Tax=Aegilops tauschii subsp. strangulata TaxID=200361 RepID=A0A453FSM1_AEGTS